MSHTAFNTSEIAAEEPVTADLWTKVKNADDDLTSRVATLEATGLTTVPLIFSVYGSHWIYGAATAVLNMRVPYNCTLTAGKLYVPIIGSSGTLTVDVQKKRGAGSFATIFSTKPSVAVAAGNYSTSTNGVLSDTDLDAGDNLRLDISVVQTGCAEFYVFLFNSL